MCIHVCVCVFTCMQRSEDNSEETIFSFHLCAVSWDQTVVIRLSSKCLYSLSPKLNAFTCWPQIKPWGVVLFCFWFCEAWKTKIKSTRGFQKDMFAHQILDVLSDLGISLVWIWMLSLHQQLLKIMASQIRHLAGQVAQPNVATEPHWAPW